MGKLPAFRTTVNRITWLFLMPAAICWGGQAVTTSMARRSSLVLFLMGVAVNARFGGLGSGTITTLLGILVNWPFLIRPVPVGNLRIEAFRLVLFLAMAGFLNWQIFDWKQKWRELRTEKARVQLSEENLRKTADSS